jgi:hypothetical protein
MEIRTKMKITLKRKLQLKSAVVYLKLQREICRDEIREYLNSNISFPNEIVERRVRNFLRDKGIYNPQGQLTSYGIKIKETGMVKEAEEGKYQIWYTQEDPLSLFNNTIFYFVRIKPETSNLEMKPVELDFSGKEFHSLPIYGKKDDKDSIEFSIAGTAKLGEVKEDTNIDCTWIWNNTNSSSFVFAGKITTSNTAKDGKPLIDDIDHTKSVDYKIDLRQHINTIIPDWNEETKRRRMKLDEIDKEDVYQYFEYSGKRSREGYDSCDYENLPVEPYNFEEAVIWRDRIINIELEKKYIHPDDFAGNINAINQKEGFSAYSGQFDVPDISQYIGKLEHGKKSDRKLAYWHLAAPQDLNVDIPQLLRIGSFSLLKDGQICFRDLAEKFGKITAEKIFYYDKYVATYFQQCSVSAFLGCFGVSDVCIITDTNPLQQAFCDYLAKNKPAITVEDIGSVFQNRKEVPHDRFVIFKHDNNLLVWTSTNSIDFIRFNSHGEINPADPGTIFQSVTFTKVKQDILGKQLENFIMKD